MADDRLIRLSKTLAYVLRHRPDAAGVELDGHGWVAVPDLIAGLGAAGHRIDEADLHEIVANDAKGRYQLRDDRVRAAQGHSVAVELGLEPLQPPDVLYHGTLERLVPRLRTEGLKPGARTHVHLSADVETARAVGARRGRPVVLSIDAVRLWGDGRQFFQASNGVWLVDHVPPGYLRHSCDRRGRQGYRQG